MHRRIPIIVITGSLILAAPGLVAQSPPPDAANTEVQPASTGPDALCKPAQLALEREQKGQLRSKTRRAQQITRQTLSEAQMGAERYWTSFRDDFITAPLTRFNTPPTTTATDAKNRSNYESLCLPMARRDQAFCSTLGASMEACQVALAAAAGESACAALGELRVACLAMRGKANLTMKHRTCSGPRRSQLCQLIIAARDDASFRACSESPSDQASKNCLMLAMFRGLGGDERACEKLPQRTGGQRRLCKAIVDGRPEMCPAMPPPVNDRRQAALTPIHTDIRATFSATKDGAPRLLMVATAARPAICHIELSARIAEQRQVVWSGVVRVPEYRASRTVVESSLAQAPYARDIEVMKPPTIAATSRCTPRYYW